LTETPELSQLHATVEGRVQGVGFRYFVQEAASSLGLTGWVRNRWDGSVEVVAEGERQDLDRFVTALHRGPRSSFVTRVKTNWQLATGEFNSFSVTHTE
jgi:acylphosphatase